MKILAIDSSGMVASVAIVTESEVSGEYTINYKKTHSQTLLPMIDEVVSFLELDLNSIDAIATSNGPGSFTGLRIGVATAKGLAQALNKKIVPIPTLEGLAYNVAETSKDELICPIMDARRKQVFTALYKLDVEESNLYKSKKITEVCPQQAIDINELIEKINEMGKEVVFLGDGVKVFADTIKENIKVPYNFAPISLREQKASSIGSLAIEYLKEGKIVEAKDFKPEYLRLSQAERVLKEKQQELKQN